MATQPEFDILFLCTGNYYRSRFAEFFLRHLASMEGYEWKIESRGLRINPSNNGPISPFTVFECDRLNIPMGPVRNPIPVTESDFLKARHVVAVKEVEHRPLMAEAFPMFENQIEYWNIHDLDASSPRQALARLRVEVLRLYERMTPAQARRSWTSARPTADGPGSASFTSSF